MPTSCNTFPLTRVIRDNNFKIKRKFGYDIARLWEVTRSRVIRANNSRKLLSCARPEYFEVELWNVSKLELRVDLNRAGAIVKNDCTADPGR